MPAATSTEDQNDDQKKMWNALKRYIMRERQRKKEEYEAEVEEERLRKEREAREKQDVMTLEETKEQIDQLEHKLKQLEKEKQQLFMQLKKVLNEDEVRKRQQQKESNEMQPLKMGPMGGNIQMPMFPMPSSGGQGDPQPMQGRPTPQNSHLLSKHQQMVGRAGGGGGAGGVKRQRSPSPTYAMYAHRMHQGRDQSVLQEHKIEDGRRQLTRAVLWNKPSQYSVGTSVSSSGAYYAMPTSSAGVVERPPPLLYAHHAHTPHTPHTPLHASMLYAPAPQPPHLYLDMLKSRDHQDGKKDGQPQVLIGLSEAHHPVVSSHQPPPVSRHLAMHTQQHATMQSSKPGSITQGYPVQQSNPNVQNPNIYPNRHRY